MEIIPVRKMKTKWGGGNNEEWRSFFRRYNIIDSWICNLQCFFAGIILSTLWSCNLQCYQDIQMRMSLWCTAVQSRQPGHFSKCGNFKFCSYNQLHRRMSFWLVFGAYDVQIDATLLCSLWKIYCFLSPLGWQRRGPRFSLSAALLSCSHLVIF